MSFWRIPKDSVPRNLPICLKSNPSCAPGSRADSWPWRGLFGRRNAQYLPPSTPNKLAEILRQAVRDTFKDRQFHEQYKKVIGVYPTPLMGEEQQKLIAALPRDNEVIKVFKTISGIDPLPPRK